MAVAMIVLSKAIQKTERQSAVVIIPSLKEVG